MNQAHASPDEMLAFRQVYKIKRFYMHVMHYVVAVTLMGVLNLVATPHRLWVLWPAVGWGLGLLTHALATFECLPILGADWEKREVEKRLGRPLCRRSAPPRATSIVHDSA